MLAASMGDPTRNVIEIKPGPQVNDLGPAAFKAPRMSPRDFASYRGKCGRPHKTKNLHHCARLAKVKRRKAR